MDKFLSSRLFQFFLVPLLVLCWFMWTDPSNGADTLLRIQMWVQAFAITGFAYMIAKSLLGKASSQELYEKASAGNTAAAIAYLGVCLLRAIVFFGLLFFFAMLTK